MTSSNAKYLYIATLEGDIYIIELNPNARVSTFPSNMIFIVSGERKLYTGTPERGGGGAWGNRPPCL